MNIVRQNKTSRLLEKNLGEIFQLESNNLFGGALITVTKVVSSKDLSIVKVYISLFDTKDKDKLFSEIVKHRKIIRYKLAYKVKNQLRIVPDLEFHIDDSLDYIYSIENLLKK
jgi:ribosome-binding factor A